MAAVVRAYRSPRPPGEAGASSCQGYRPRRVDSLYSPTGPRAGAAGECGGRSKW
ncbi:hypothetical protein SEA_KROMP_72 [Streptomyces phage Kromp]|uniref:Uncharacterized protein n=1 Tax=Streptomyces phage Kromp TaxID=2315619 RepID=A0A386K8X5_9CAUD|nr:hypothetical protein SEA_KROMP_72 [Streptomyces phage Kromp]